MSIPSRDVRIRLQAQLDQRDREIALLREKQRIKDARMECVPAQRRPHYPPIERLAHLITDHGPQFTAGAFDDWCRRHHIQQRFGAIGKYGSLAVIERYIRSLKNECTRLLPVVPLARAAFGRELDAYAAWYDAERPHSRFGARTPDEIYFGTFPACRRPRFERRARWPRRSSCAMPHALVRGRPGAVVGLVVEHRGGRRHLPIVSLRRVA